MKTNAPTDLADLLAERKLLLAVAEKACVYLDAAEANDVARMFDDMQPFYAAVRAYRAATTGEARQ